MTPERWEVPPYVLEAVRVRPAAPEHLWVHVRLAALVGLVVFLAGLVVGFMR